MTDWWFGGKLNFSSFQNSIFFQNGSLWLIVTKGFFTIKTLVKNHTHTPNLQIKKILTLL